MGTEELIELIRVRPFVPLYLTDGQTYDLWHPDQVIVLRDRVNIGVGADLQTGVVDHVDHISLLHVVRVEPIDSQSAQAAS